MSAFAPQDVTEGNDRRKKLAQQLWQRHQAQQQQQARPIFGGGRPFNSFGSLPRAPMPQLTRPFPTPPGLQERLGPGGFGAPGQADFSPAPGAPAPFGGVGAPSAPVEAGPPEDPAMDIGGAAGRTLYGPNSPDQLVPEADIFAGQLVPLGGGRFFNPATGEIQGTTIGGRGTFAGRGGAQE